MKKIILPFFLFISIILLLILESSNSKVLTTNYLDKDKLYTNINNKNIKANLILVNNEPQLMIITQENESAKLNIYDLNKKESVLNHDLSYILKDKPYKIRISTGYLPQINLISADGIATIELNEINNELKANVNFKSSDNTYKDFYSSNLTDFYIYESSPNILKSSTRQLGFSFFDTQSTENNFFLSIRNIVSWNQVLNSIYYSKVNEGEINLYSYPLKTSNELKPLAKESLLHKNIYYSTELFSSKYEHKLISLSYENDKTYKLKAFPNNFAINIDSDNKPMATGYSLNGQTRIFYTTYNSLGGKIISVDPSTNTYKPLCYNLPYIEEMDVCPSIDNPNKYIILFKTNEDGTIKYFLYSSLDFFEEDITEIVFK